MILIILVSPQAYAQSSNSNGTTIYDAIIQDILQIITDEEYGLEEIQSEVEFIENEIQKMTASTPSPKISKLQDTVSAIVYIPFGSSPELTLELRNIGTADANLTAPAYSDFSLKEESTFSMLDYTIDSSVMMENNAFPLIITPNEFEKLSWTFNQMKYDEGTYLGKIFLNGNFETIPVTVSISYVVPPWVILGLNFGGIGIALLIGKEKQKKEIETKNINKIKKCYDTLIHVTEHIVWINKERKRVSENCWGPMRKIAEEYVTKIEKEVKSGTLNSKSENFLWFEEFHKTIQKEVWCGNTEYPNEKSIRIPNKDSIEILLNKMLGVKTSDETVSLLGTTDPSMKKEDIVEQDYTLQFIAKNDLLRKALGVDDADKVKLIKENSDDQNLKNLHDTIKTLVKKRDKNSNKKVFFVITSIFTTVTSVFVIDSFVGPLWLNAIYAIGLGIGVYRSQDLSKLFKKDDKDE